MAYRYANRRIVLNDDESYRTLLRERGLKHFRQFTSPDLSYPDLSEVKDLRIISYTWKFSDRYYKVAHEFYGDSTLWWVIAWFNKKPTEAHVKIGDVLEIPLPIEKVLAYYEI